MDSTRQAQDKPGFKLEHKQPSQETAGFANVPLMGSVQLREPGTPMLRRQTAVACEDAPISTTCLPEARSYYKGRHWAISLGQD